MAKVFPQFISKYPNVDSLSRARRETLLTMLRPLGLANTRVETLIRVARKLKAARTFPRSIEQLKELDGVGDYIASAVLCLGFGLDVPMVDVNAIRVIGRISGVSDTHSFYRSLRTDTQELNLAILGHAHVICKVARPKCEECPVSPHCRYFELLGPHRSNAAKQR